MTELDIPLEEPRPAIAVCAGHLGDPTGVLGWRLTNELCQERDVDLIGISEAPGSDRSFSAYSLELLRSPRCRGVFVLRGSLPANARAVCAERGLPVVCLGSDKAPEEPGSSCALVRLDRTTSIYQLIEHLVNEHGRRRVAAVLTNEADLSLTRELLEGRGLAADRVFLSAGAYAPSDLARCFAGKAPDAVIFGHPGSARAGLGTIQGMGYLVPQDVAVACTASYLLNPYMLPALTDIGPSYEERTARALDMLLAHVLDERSPESLVLTAEVQPRHSCGCVATRLRAAYRREADAIDYLYAKRAEIANQMVQEGLVSDELIQGHALRPWIDGLLNTAYSLLEEDGEAELYACGGGVERLPEHLVVARRRMLWVLQDAILNVLPDGPVRERIAVFLRLQWKAFAAHGNVPPGYYGDLDHASLYHLEQLRNALHLNVTEQVRCGKTAAALPSLGMQGVILMARIRTDAPRSWAIGDVQMAVANGRRLEFADQDPAAPLDIDALSGRLRAGNESMSLCVMGLTSLDDAYEGLLLADGRGHGQILEHLREAFSPLVFGSLANEADRRHAEALADERRLLRDVLDGMPDAIFVKNLEGRFLLANRTSLAGMGFTEADQIVGKTDADVMAAGAAEEQRRIERQILATGEPLLNQPERGRDGRHFLVSRIPIRDRTGRVTGLVGIKHDVSALQAAETQLQEKDELLARSHKFEAIGRLASGIAHDFNNVLTIIQNYAELIGRRPEPDKVVRHAGTIGEAAQRAARLTHDLLSFSSAQTLDPHPCDLNRLIDQADGLLHGAVGDQVEIVYRLSPEPCPVMIDPLAMEQILVNLTVNARDAMAAGGTLVFSTESVELEDGRHRSTLGPGRFVRLIVYDTGQGIDPRDLPNIFDPFFSTKTPDKGTGLGLSTAYGTIKQAGGDIEVESTMGAGTRFVIWLPDVGESDYVAADVAFEIEAIRGDETILVVDDDVTVCQVVCDVLAGSDYTVHQATSPAAALELADGLPDGPDLLVTDVMMPATNGIQLAERLRERFPRLKVLFMSGMTDVSIRELDPQNTLANFLPKPFDSQTLHDKIREAIETSTKIYRRRSTRRFRHDASEG